MYHSKQSKKPKTLLGWLSQPEVVAEARRTKHDNRIVESCAKIALKIGNLYSNDTRAINEIVAAIREKKK